MALFNAVETYLQLSAEQASVYERLKRREEERAVRKSEMTWADRMRAEGHSLGLQRGLEKGIQKGRAQGLGEGQAEGARRMLKHLLHLRFGDLPAAAVAKVDGIRSVARLTRLAEKVLVAGSLAEMGLAGPAAR